MSSSPFLHISTSIVVHSSNSFSSCILVSLSSFFSYAHADSMAWNTQPFLLNVRFAAGESGQSLQSGACRNPMLCEGTEQARGGEQWRQGRRTENIWVGLSPLDDVQLCVHATCELDEHRHLVQRVQAGKRA